MLIATGCVLKTARLTGWSLSISTTSVAYHAGSLLQIHELGGVR